MVLQTSTLTFNQACSCDINYSETFEKCRTRMLFLTYRNWGLAGALFTTGSGPLPQPVCCAAEWVCMKVRAIVNSITTFSEYVMLCPERRYEGAKWIRPHYEKQGHGRRVGGKNVGQATMNGQCSTNMNSVNLQCCNMN